MTLYAIWSLNSFSVNYYDAESLVTTTTENYNSDGILQAPAPLSYTGWTFLGWNTDYLATSPLVNYAITGNTDFSAIWQINSYPVTYDPANGDTTVVSSETYGTDVISAAPGNPSLSGYSFVGWNTDPTATVGLDLSTTYADGAMTLYAIWSLDTYNAPTYTVNYEDFWYVEYFVSQTEQLNSDAVLQQPTPPSTQGYTFLGWNTDYNSSTVFSNYAVTGSVTLYAIWAIDSYAVTYDPTNGNVSTVHVREYNTDVISTAPVDPTRSAFTFIGWNTDPSATTGLGTGSTYLTESMTLYALWSAQTVTVTYQDSATATVYNTASEYPGSDAVAQATANPTRAGYSFIGWSATSSASAGSFAVPVPTHAFTVYAIWHANSYAVTYDPNNGGTPTTRTETYGSNAVSQANTSPTRTGYALIGWSTDPAATTGQSTALVNGPVTLYAVFAPSRLLTLTEVGPGSVSSFSGNIAANTSGAASTYEYSSGYVETLTTHPGALHTYWQGACAGTIGNVCHVTMNGPLTVLVRFVPNYSIPTFFFASDKYKVIMSAAQTATIVSRLRVLAALGVTRYNLQGYADHEGNFTYNIALSLHRTQAVAAWLRALVKKYGINLTFELHPNGQTQKFGGSIANNRRVVVLF